MALAAGACAKEQAVPEEQVVQGACQPVFGANVCAWDRMSGTTLTAFGATVPMQAIDSAPKRHDRNTMKMTEKTVTNAVVKLVICDCTRYVSSVANMCPEPVTKVLTPTRTWALRP